MFPVAPVTTITGALSGEWAGWVGLAAFMGVVSAFPLSGRGAADEEEGEEERGEWRAGRGRGWLWAGSPGGVTVVQRGPRAGQFFIKGGATRRAYTTYVRCNLRSRDPLMVGCTDAHPHTHTLARARRAAR
ncbi:hypothetical protein GCM10012285_48110 [Streptomyces kronopolitis]|uniref:Uncharacterized protein n=1 Tax=Streptomyces kronopolitis TaxID=1612435 RepID=A0ABQ2JT69_9ACTN|nr:hypothetical protein GCM10012285_48110 [Streptomyces kronopolitis]